ncbi:MAG: TetR/AcrR family transcriptional regulator [Rhizobiaceae bacterium]|nr:TetR/AcrR family transcriptional regulator [Rhizobiaceae bacterium]
MDTRLRRPPKQRRSRGRIEEILAAARRLIGEKGIDAVRMREIAVLAGGPISSIYQYFPNKSAILAMLFEQWSEGLEIMIRERLERVGDIDGLMSAASDLLDHFHSRIADDPGILDLLNAVQADKALSDIDLAASRRHAEWFCAAGERFIPQSRHAEFRRSTFLMFHLAFGVVRMALWDKPEDGSVLGDFKAIIRGQITLLAAPG